MSWISHVVVRRDVRSAGLHVQDRLVGGRLTVLGRDDDQGILVKVLFLQFLDHLADRFIGVIDCLGQRRARRVLIVYVACRGEFLTDADGLEVHAEDSWNIVIIHGAVRGLAVDLVQDRLYLDVIVSFLRFCTVGVDADAADVDQGIVGFAVRRGIRQVDASDYAAVRDQRVDFWRVQIFNARARGAVDQIVAGVLVRPCCMHARAFDHFEYGVDLHEIVRVDGSEGLAIRAFLQRQIQRVDAPAEQLHRVVIDGFVEHNLGARAPAVGRVVAGEVARRVQRPVVTVIVKHARRLRRSARNQGEQSGEGIRGSGRRRVAVGDAVL